MSSLCLGIVTCVTGAQGRHCRAAQARTCSPPLTHQLSLLSSGQGEPLPLAAALCHLRRICRRRRPVVHAKRHQLPSAPDALPLQRKASSSRAWAPGPCLEPQGRGGGVKTYPLFPLVHPGSTLAKAFPVLFSPFARRDGCGEKGMRPVCSLCPGGPEKPRGRRAWVGSGSVQPGLPLV